MNNKAVIKVEGLGKEYVIGSRERAGETLREVLVSSFAAPFRRLQRLGGRGAAQECIWALKDVSFNVDEGEVVGIIGRNGAGKSTLLKILTRITAPTEGRVTIRGRVASLLEVGTGFHPELTGRENIYLNGAILGMAAEEIRRKFDRIVDFSGVEKFLDTPVKRYSSGMTVRLAFAVAAHLDPEILIVDEVLAVGDAEFQRKCLGKMGEVARSGRTVLLVSHNMSAIRNICTSAIWIDQGMVREIDEPSIVIDNYISGGADSSDQMVRQFTPDPGKPFQILSAQAVNKQGTPSQVFSCDQTVAIECECVLRNKIPGLYGYLMLSKVDGTEIMESDSFDTNPNPFEGLPLGRTTLRIAIPARTLGAGEYSAYLNFTSPQNFKSLNVDSPAVVARFRLDDSSSRRGNRRRGFFSTCLEWRLEARVAATESRVRKVAAINE